MTVNLYSTTLNDTRTLKQPHITLYKPLFNTRDASSQNFKHIFLKPTFINDILLIVLACVKDVVMCERCGYVFKEQTYTMGWSSLKSHSKLD